MVNSNTVTNDLNTLKNNLKNYQSEIESLNSSWKGISHDSLVAKAEEFQSEYLSTLEGEMTSLASACDLYEQYKSTKQLIEAERNKYNQAQSNNDANGMNTYASNINMHESTLSNLKSQIESYLETASSTILTAASATAIASGINSISPTGGLTQENIEVMMNAAKSQLGLPYNSMHYGPREGDGEGFGCAMFVSYCYNQALFNGASGQERGLGGFYGSTWEYWGNVTNDGYDAYNKGFVEVPAEEAQPGDVIAFLKLNEGNDYHDSYSNCYHVGLYEGDGVMVESGGLGVAEIGIDVNREDIRFLRYVGTSENA